MHPKKYWKSTKNFEQFLLLAENQNLDLKSELYKYLFGFVYLTATPGLVLSLQQEGFLGFSPVCNRAYKTPDTVVEYLLHL